MKLGRISVEDSEETDGSDDSRDDLKDRTAKGGPKKTQTLKRSIADTYAAKTTKITVKQSKAPIITGKPTRAKRRSCCSMM